MSQFLTLLLLRNQLLQKQVPIVLLRQVLYLKFSVLLHECPILIVDPLGNLSHCVQILIKLSFPLLEVLLSLAILISLAPVVLGLQLPLDVLELLV